MAGSKASRVPNVWDTLRNQNNQINRDFALSRRVFNPQTIAIPPSPEIAPAGNSGSDSGNALQTAGGSMIGAIAYFPIALFIQDLEIGKADSETSRVLDISAPIGAASSRILANGGVGTTLLEFIKGGAYAGQQLNIQGTLTQNLTIKNDDSSNGSEGLNIRTQTGGDLSLVGNANILLVFDVTSNQWAVVSSIEGGAAVLSLGQLSDVAISPDPPIANDILQFNLISGLWENQPSSAGGGMLTDLSNMADPTVPVVPLKMNTQNILEVNVLDFASGGSRTITSLTDIFFNQSQQSIESDANGLNIKVNANQEIIFETTNGIIAKFDEVNSNDRRLEMQGNKIQDVGKLLFSPVFDTDTTNFAQIYEDSVTNNLRYVSKVSHVFVNNLGTVQMTLGDFVGNGGFLQDISEFKMLGSTPSIISVDGEFQNVFQSGSSGPADMIIRSGGNEVNLTTLFENTNSGQFADDTFNIFNAAVPSKVAQFNAAQIGAGITRTYSFQNANGTLAMLNGTQQNFSVNVGLTNNNLVDVGGIFTTAALSDIGQNTNYFDDLFINQIFFFGDPVLGYKIGGDITNGFDFVLPDATREFDFFFDGGTTPSLVVRNAAIDAMGSDLLDLNILQFRQSTDFGGTDALGRIFFSTVNDLISNVPSGGSHLLRFDGSNGWVFNESSLTGENIFLGESLFFADSTASIISSGQMARNGLDILVSTSEGVKNMKDIGSGGGDFLPLAGGTMSGSINLGGNDLTSVDDMIFVGASSGINLNGGSITNFDTLQADASGNSEIFMIGGFIDMDDGEIRDADDITMHGNSRIMSVGITEFGIQVDNASANVGSSGMMAMPQAIPPVVPTKADLDGFFGTHEGAMGIDTGLVPHLFVRSTNGDWFRFNVDSVVTV